MLDAIFERFVKHSPVKLVNYGLPITIWVPKGFYLVYPSSGTLRIKEVRNNPD